jgi:hypothetical protein
LICEVVVACPPIKKSGITFFSIFFENLPGFERGLPAHVIWSNAEPFNHRACINAISLRAIDRGHLRRYFPKLKVFTPKAV